MGGVQTVDGCMRLSMFALKKCSFCMAVLGRVPGNLVGFSSRFPGTVFPELLAGPEGPTSLLALNGEQTLAMYLTLLCLLFHNKLGTG